MLKVWWRVQHKLGLVVGKFAPPHKGHQLVIDTALEVCDQVIVLVYSNPDFSEMPSHARADWIRWAYRNNSCLQVFVPQDSPPNDADEFMHREAVRIWLEEHGFKPDAVFGSEEYIPGFAAHIGVKPFVVDLERMRVPTSGTEVRRIWNAYRASVKFVNEPPLFYTTPGDLELFVALEERMGYAVLEASQRWREPAHRVVLMGAESTGKSAMCGNPRMANLSNRITRTSPSITVNSRMPQWSRQIAFCLWTRTQLPPPIWDRSTTEPCRIV
jgi:HTH-type transcriptional regulator, transcriptional repressor of NAD biosynthesis genes